MRDDLSVIMSNLRFDMRCRGEAQLVEAMKLLCAVEGIDCPGGKTPGGKPAGFTHYRIYAPEDAVLSVETRPYQPRKPHRIAFARPYSDKKDWIELPFHLDGKGAADFAWRWLAEADYGKQPDHDGDNVKGWRLHNDSGSGWIDAIIVEAIWAEIGK